MKKEETVKVFDLIKHNGLGIPILIIVFLLVMILPLPAFLLDLLFTFSISLSLMVLLASIYAKRPLDFAVFPTVLLISTLFRLALNIASTRLVLLNGHTGTDAAGSVIQAFGEVVIGGNYAVGLVVFSIFIIINFVVVTKGSGRISEVSARFMLDAMPGKQMAIDADLNSGLINQDEARKRREEVASEADFYGSMDGASKFVRGDAVAGILILLINLIGGLAIGSLQYGLTFMEALSNYALLTIGDGLVAQIPALLLSSAAALMVTRVSREEDMGDQVISQMVHHPRVLVITAVVLAALGVIPGMPHLAFLGVASVIGFMAYQEHLKKLTETEKASLKAQLKAKKEEIKEESDDVDWDDIAQVDKIGLELGLRLIPLVDPANGAKLSQRIKGVRKKLSQEFGFLIPFVHVWDNLELSPQYYRISIRGVVVGEGEIYPEYEMAINPGQAFGTLRGIKTKDPSFGLDALWIEKGLTEEAQTKGYTVVDASTVMATHLTQLITVHSHELLSHEEVQKLLEKLSEKSPRLVEDLVPAVVSQATLVRVLRCLLEERVPIRDFHTIIESIAEIAPKNKDAEVLVAAVRVALANLIIQSIGIGRDELPVVTLTPPFEKMLLNSNQATQNGVSVIEPGLTEQLGQRLKELSRDSDVSGEPSVLLVTPVLRPILAKFARIVAENVYVLSYQEVPDNRKIKIVRTIGG